MKQKAIKRGFLGFPLGIALSYVITILISLVKNDGTYYPVVPELMEVCSNEVTAVLIQTLLSGILGIASAASSIIWEIDRFSILKQTVLHFLVLSCTMLPIAYITRWMEHTVRGVITYFAIFIVMYLLIWLSQYLSLRKKVRQMNAKVQS